MKPEDLETTRRNVRVLDALKSSRQVAFETSREDGGHLPWFEQAQELYERFAKAIGVDPEPVFDEDAYRERMEAKGHPDFALSPRH